MHRPDTIRALALARAIRAAMPSLRCEASASGVRVYRADAAVGAIAHVIIWPLGYEIIRGGWPRPEPTVCADISAVVEAVRAILQP